MQLNEEYTILGHLTLNEEYKDEAEIGYIYDVEKVRLLEMVNFLHNLLYLS